MYTDKIEYFITIELVISYIMGVGVFFNTISHFFMAFEYSRKLINLKNITKDKMTGLMRRDVFERCYKE